MPKNTLLSPNIDPALRPPFEPDTMHRLWRLEGEGIPYGIYSGAHVAFITGKIRPIGDVDVMIRKEHYDRVRKLLGGQAYDLQPLFWPTVTPQEHVSFLAIGDMEIKAGSDGAPGYFTFNELVERHCTTIEENDHRMRFVSPTETFLFKVALWRPKDQVDVQTLLNTPTVTIDSAYLHERLNQTGMGARLHSRLAMLLGPTY